MKLLITEKPSVAMEFAKALNVPQNKKNGYIEANRMDNNLVLWTFNYNELSRSL